MYEDMTEDVLKERMLEQTSTYNDEGGFIYDAVAPVATELAEMYSSLDEVLEQVFAQTASGEYLEKRCAEFGIYRKAGTKATGQVKFTGNDGTVIPAGTLVQTESGLQFQTKVESTISNSQAIADIEAIEASSNYNVPANSIVELPVQIVGVVSVTNEQATTGGTNEEDDASLLNRLLVKVQTPATS